MRMIHENCPQCATENVTQARRCRCGHRFTSPTSDAGDATAPTHERPEGHDYLAARVEEAEALLETARREAQADPENIYKAAQALTAQQALNAARAQWRAQALLQAPPKHQPALAAARKPAPAIGDQAPRVMDPTASAKAPAITPPAPAAAVTVASKPPAPPSSPASQINKFRSQQAARAEVVVRRASAKKKLAAEKSAMAVAVTVKECPNCTATLPTAAAQCGCGYRLGNASLEMPALRLDDGARAMLTDTDRLALDRG